MRQQTLIPFEAAIAPADTADKQALRLRRFAMAAATYAFCALLAAAAAWAGQLSIAIVLWWVLGAALVNAVFFVLLRSGWNLRLSEPSMTEPQLHASMLAALVLISQADAARGAFLMFLPVPLMFGVLRLNLWQMARVGAVALAGYGACVGLIAWRQPERLQGSLEWLQMAVLAGVMVFVCILGGYISNIRGRLVVAMRTIHGLAHRDVLTGLYNRRDFMERLDVEVARCRRQLSRGVVLCMIDVDHFKQVNDVHGHLTGDEALVRIARSLGQSARANDYLARFGGEEFVALLEAGSESTAQALCERMLQGVAQIRIEGHPGLRLGISIGLARMTPDDDASSLIQRADQALYRAKSEGRGCIRVAATPGAAAPRPG